MLDRRSFFDRAGRFVVGSLAAGAAFEILGGRSAVEGRGLAGGQTPSVQPPNITPPTIQKIRDNFYIIGGADAEQRSSWTGGSNFVFITRKHGVVLVDTKNPG
jgi:hypothetical protein